jgi:signal transduction histidine kinase
MKVVKAREMKSKRITRMRSGANARLVRSQEQELVRIAQELHDDIGASLGVLGIEMLRAGQPVPGSPEKLYPGIPEVYEKIQEISKRISRLSHQLDPPALKYLGLAQALKTECRLFSEDCQIPAVCTCDNVPAKIDPAAGLCIVRVLQEALRNAARHSGASRVEVQAVASDVLLTLTVRDDGRGFTREQRRSSEGLGFVGMRQRMLSVGGNFQIRSRPGKGTELICAVPL